MTEGKQTVDNAARTDIAVIKERIEHLSYVVTSHMDAEEKQREKLEQELNGIGSRVGKLTKLLWLVMGIAGGPQILEMVASGTIPI